MATAACRLLLLLLLRLLLLRRSEGSIDGTVVACRATAARARPPTVCVVGSLGVWIRHCVSLCVTVHHCTILCTIVCQCASLCVTMRVCRIERRREGGGGDTHIAHTGQPLAYDERYPPQPGSMLAMVARVMHSSAMLASASEGANVGVKPKRPKDCC